MSWSAKLREEVFSIVEARTGTKLRQSIVHELVNTPSTWEEMFNLDKGTILGLSHSFFNVLAFRLRTDIRLTKIFTLLVQVHIQVRWFQSVWLAGRLRANKLSMIIGFHILGPNVMVVA